MYKWETRARANGSRLQAGIPQQRMPYNYDNASGLLLRGVVVATYEVDNAENPEVKLSSDVQPAAIYCDVLAYTSLEHQQVLFLPAVLVSQDVGGLHRGRVWKPRAASVNISGGALDIDGPTAAASLDGDHVLVGFIDQKFNAPVILRGIPHPSADIGNEERAAGNRLKLKTIDGDPDFQKHHGSFFGIDTSGNWVADTRFANNGSVDGGGNEPAPPTDGKGGQLHHLPLDGTFAVTLYDMSNPDSPSTKAQISLTKDALTVNFLETSTVFHIDKAGEIIELGKVGAGDKAVLNSAAENEHQDIRDKLSSLSEQVEKHRHALNMYFFPMIPNPANPIKELIQAPVAIPPGGAPRINAITGAEAKSGTAPIDIGAGAGEYDPLLLTEGGNASDVSSSRVTIDK